MSVWVSLLLASLEASLLVGGITTGWTEISSVLQLSFTIYYYVSNDYLWITVL